MSRCPKESFEEKNFFQKIKVLDHFRSLTAKYFGFSAKTLHQGCQKGILRVLGNFLNNSLGRKEHMPFYHFSDFEQKNFGLSAKNPAGLSKLSLTIREEFSEFFLKKIHPPHNFYNLSIKQLNYCLKDFGRFVKLLQLQKNNLEETVFWETYKYFFRFLDFERSFLRLLKRSF